MVKNQMKSKIVCDMRMEKDAESHDTVKHFFKTDFPYECLPCSGINAFALPCPFHASFQLPLR